tara:strand:+ start:304 stop:471 length:168 start_codon:yes stop_codon:yes gene_type:complete
MGEVIAVIGCVIGGICIGILLSTSSIREDAVKAGVAYYDCVPETGDCAFTFGVPK